MNVVVVVFIRKIICFAIFDKDF